jgi:hypothetical protein
MNKSVFGVALVAAVFSIGTPVAAKGARQLTVTGTALGRPIVIDAADGFGELELVVEQTRFYEAVFGDSAAAAGAFGLTGIAPTARLGMRLRLSWDMAVEGSPSPDDVVVQELFPYAAGGPVVHTPAGQVLYGAAVPAGWVRAQPALVGTLRRLGFTSLEESASAPIGLRILRW